MMALHLKLLVLLISAATATALSLKASWAKRSDPRFTFDNWIQATATCYGGGDGSGTMNGACGYSNLFEQGYGLDTAAASVYMFGNGRTCGSCWEIQCLGSHCTNRSITVTVTNLCPDGSEGGWCNNPKTHFDMSCPAWNTIAAPPEAGVVDVRARRVACTRKGGIAIKAETGHRWWQQFSLLNVGGSGDVKKVMVSVDGGKSWENLGRNWGMRWDHGGESINGKAVSFRLVSAVGKKSIRLKNVLPPNWTFGQTYWSHKNF